MVIDDVCRATTTASSFIIYNSICFSGFKQQQQQQQQQQYCGLRDGWIDLYMEQQQQPSILGDR